MDVGVDWETAQMLGELSQHDAGGHVRTVDRGLGCASAPAGFFGSEQRAGIVLSCFSRNWTKPRERLAYLPVRLPAPRARQAGVMGERSTRAPSPCPESTNAQRSSMLRKTPGSGTAPQDVVTGQTSDGPESFIGVRPLSNSRSTKTITHFFSREAPCSYP